MNTIRSTQTVWSIPALPANPGTAHNALILRAHHSATKRELVFSAEPVTRYARHGIVITRHVYAIGAASAGVSDSIPCARYSAKALGDFFCASITKHRDAIRAMHAAIEADCGTSLVTVNA